MDNLRPQIVVMLRVALLTIPALVLLTPNPALATQWTLERVLESTRHADPGVQAARARAEAEQDEAHHTLKTLSPRVHLVGNYLRTDNPAFIFAQKLEQGRFAQEDFDLDALNQPPTESAVQLGVDVAQPVWNGGSEITSPALSRHLSQSSIARENIALSDRLLQAVIAYVAAVRARAAMQADSISVQAAEQILMTAKTQFALELAPELDTLRATTRLAEARAQFLASQKDHDVALIQLSQIVDTLVTPESLGTLPAPEELRDLDESVEEPWEVRAAKEQVGVQQVWAKRAGFDLLPSLNLRFNYSYYLDPNGDTGETRWAGWVLVDLPIWDGLERIQKLNSAKARAREAEAELERVRRVTDLRLLTAQREKTVALAELRTAELALRSSQEALHHANDRYQAGLLPISELTSADADAANARKNFINAESRIVIAHYQVLRSMGRLQ